MSWFHSAAQCLINIFPKYSKNRLNVYPDMALYWADVHAIGTTHIYSLYLELPNACVCWLGEYK